MSASFKRWPVCYVSKGDLVGPGWYESRWTVNELDRDLSTTDRALGAR